MPLIRVKHFIRENFELASHFHQLYFAIKSKIGFVNLRGSIWLGLHPHFPNSHHQASYNEGSRGQTKSIADVNTVERKSRKKSGSRYPEWSFMPSYTSTQTAQHMQLDAFSCCTLCSSCFSPEMKRKQNASDKRCSNVVEPFAVFFVAHHEYVFFRASNCE